MYLYVQSNLVISITDNSFLSIFRKFDLLIAVLNIIYSGQLQYFQYSSIQKCRLLHKIRPTIYVNTYNISGVSSIPEGIAAKFIIAGFIDYKHAYIVEIQTTYKVFNCDRF